MSETARWPAKTEDAGAEADAILALIEARRRRGLSQYQLAALIGVSRTALYNWEAGLAYPDRWAKWARWARAVGLNFEAGLRRG